MRVWGPLSGGARETRYDTGLRSSRPPPFKVERGTDGTLPRVLQRNATTSRSRVTTSGREHSGRPQAGWQVQTRYPKAAPHWTTHCLAPLAMRLKGSASLRGLSAPVSEARDRYRGGHAPQNPVPEPLHALASVNKQPDSGRWAVEPPVSTAHASYRPVQRSDLIARSRLDVPPAYSAHQRSRVHAAPPPRRPPPAALTSLDGSRTEYRSSFTAAPPLVAATQGYRVPQRTSPNQEGPGAEGVGPVRHPSDTRLAVFEVPLMYATESDSYGSGKPRGV